MFQLEKIDRVNCPYVPMTCVFAKKWSQVLYEKPAA